MSYILDALKKSEAERQQQQAPGFAVTPGQSRTRSTPLWIWLVAGLLLINAAVLAALLLRPADKLSQGTVVVPAAVPGQADTDISFSEIVRDARQRTPAATTTVERDEPADRDDAVASRMPARPEARPAVPRETPQAAPATAVDRAPPRSSATLPTYFELSANGQLQLPPLHIDIHVHSATASDRFVFINMNKYRENDRLQEGPRVQEITADGVVLEQDGRSFLLPRE